VEFQGVIRVANPTELFPNFFVAIASFGQWYLPLAEALDEEGRHGVPIVAAEGAAGARRFVEGAGRGGKFGE
jgi:hypothetical protein